MGGGLLRRRHRTACVMRGVQRSTQNFPAPTTPAASGQRPVASFSDLYWKWVLGIKLLFFALRHPRNKGLASTSLWRGYSQFRFKKSAVWKLFKKAAIQ